MCDSFFLLSLFVTLYIFLHLTVMHSSTFGKGWVGMSACPLVVLACESLHVCTVCIWRCEHARFCVEVFYALYINFHSFIHSRETLSFRIVSIAFSTVIQCIFSKGYSCFKVAREKCVCMGILKICHFGQRHNIFIFIYLYWIIGWPTSRYSTLSTC